jgi:hypothetical protein
MATNARSRAPKDAAPPPPPSPPRLAQPFPSRRELRVYAFDPSRGRRLGNFMTVNVKFEELAEGLKGAQLHVIDYDAVNNTYYKEADLNSAAALVEGGYAPSESDPRFHQQMCYAVAMNTISVFESALGRDIRYSFMDPDATAARTQLRIFPHAMFEPNAYYAPELGALLFGYFQASEEDAGSGLPGGTVFTCLSHDIVAHETVHSIIDTLRQSFMRPTNKDVLAFHEGFSDIVALFQHFRFEEVVRDTLQRSGGVLHRFELSARGATATEGEKKQPMFLVGEMPEGNPLLDLARQFGEAMGTRKALRSALGIPPEPTALATLTEVHERGAILVAAVFDAFFSSFMQRSWDLVRLGRAVAGGTNEIHPDIAARLAKEAAKTASHFCTMCIRALDYCPPVDITFSDFLRALITADTDLYQSDAHDYREALIQAFRARGIVPKDVKSLAEESLLWSKPDPCVPACEGLAFNLDDPYEHTAANKAKLDAVIRQPHNAWYFGICANPDHKTADQCDCVITEPDLVKSVNMVIREGQGRPTVQFVAEIVRTITSVPLVPELTEFSGGSTVIFDSRGRAKYIIYKNLNSEGRAMDQRDFVNGALEMTPLANYSNITSAPLQLAAIHRGF